MTTQHLQAYEDKREIDGLALFRYNRTLWVRSGLGFLLAVRTLDTLAKAEEVFGSLSDGSVWAFVNANHNNCSSFR